MEEMRGPAGRNMWQKLTNVQAAAARQLPEERVPADHRGDPLQARADHTARVLSALPPSSSLIEVVNRMLTWSPVHKDVLQEIDGALRREFIDLSTRAARRDPHEQMADIMNRLRPQRRGAFPERARSAEPATAPTRSRRCSPSRTFAPGPGWHPDAPAVPRQVDLAQALKGASETLRNLFLSKHDPARRKDAPGRNGRSRPHASQGRRRSAAIGRPHSQTVGGRRRLLQLDRSGEAEEMVF